MPRGEMSCEDVCGLGGLAHWSWHHTDGHACGACCFDAHLAVFEDEAAVGWNSQALSRQQEGFWVGLAMRDIIRCDNGIEISQQPQMIERFGHKRADAARGDCHGCFSMIFAHQSHYWLDRFDRVELLAENPFFGFDRLLDRDVYSVPFRQDFDNSVCFCAAEVVEHRLWKRNSVGLECLAPSFVMSGHRVGHCSIAIKNVGIEFSIRYFQFHPRLRLQWGGGASQAKNKLPRGTVGYNVVAELAVLGVVGGSALVLDAQIVVAWMSCTGIDEGEAYPLEGVAHMQDETEKRRSRGKGNQIGERVGVKAVAFGMRQKA